MHPFSVDNHRSRSIVFKVCVSMVSYLLNQMNNIQRMCFCRYKEQSMPIIQTWSCSLLKPYRSLRRLLSRHGKDLTKALNSMVHLSIIVTANGFETCKASNCSKTLIYQVISFDNGLSSYCQALQLFNKSGKSVNQWRVATRNLCTLF